jgi:hypothetical protein
MATTDEKENVTGPKDFSNQAALSEVSPSQIVRAETNRRIYRLRLAFDDLCAYLVKVQTEEDEEQVRKMARLDQLRASGDLPPRRSKLPYDPANNLVPVLRVHQVREESDDEVLGGNVVLRAKFRNLGSDVFPQDRHADFQAHLTPTDEKAPGGQEPSGGSQEVA